MSRDEHTTHFGFQTVAADAKASLVADVFHSVAPKYDLMNDLMSWGLHRLWKAAMIDWLAPRSGMRILDVGGGTGDIAFAILDRAPAAVTVCDINPSMVDVGRNRAIDSGRIDEPKWVCGDAEHLPVAERSVDAVTTAFCLRNVTDIPAALAEARRVLKPGGRFLCLEFSQVILPLLAPFYDVYSFRVLPALGGLVADDREAYQYLAESIRRFPPQAEFGAMIEAAGFGRTRWLNLSGGIAAMHSAWRI